jgi:hypothetical protein
MCRTDVISFGLSVFFLYGAKDQTRPDILRKNQSKRRNAIMGRVQGYSEHKSIWTNPVAVEPTQVGGLDHGESVTPAIRPTPHPRVQRAKTGRMRGLVGLCP